jgi:exodeoxyribonuclease VII small subunit
MMQPKARPSLDEPVAHAAGNGPRHGDTTEACANEDSATTASVVQDMSFEDAIRRLGHIVEQLERGDLPLEASLRLFEEGIGLARVSQRRLDRAERRIEELLGVDAEGQPVTRPFEAKLDGG